MRQGFWVIYGAIFLILNISYYLDNTPTSSYYLPLIFVFLMLVITGLFEFREYYNKFLYQVVLILVLSIMWIVIYIQPISHGVDTMVYYVETGLLTIMLIWMFIYLPKEWEKKEKALKPYNEVLTTNPNDIIALNNKGFELTRQRKYKKAMKCFDRILEINSEDSAALHNKGVLLDKKGKIDKGRTYFDKSLELDPRLEKAKEEGKLILESKKRKYRKSMLKTKEHGKINN